MTEPVNQSLRLALWYRRHLNWSIFPVHGMKDGKCTCGNPNCDRPAKHAVIKWEAHQRTLPSVEQVIADFERRPWANVGLATGRVSGVVVVDADVKPGDNGEESLRDLVEVFGQLPDTVEALTGGGGRHIYFRHPGVETRNRTRFAKGLDFRGDGGYVLLPRSAHASGRNYEWEASSRPDEVAPADMPEWLMGLIVEPQNQEMPGGNQEATDWAKIVMEGAQEGSRNDTATRLAGRLFRHGLHPKEVWAWMVLWNERMKAPLSESELLRTVTSIAQRELAMRNQRRRTTG